MATTINTDNNYPLGPVVPLKADGSPGAIDTSTAPTWASSDETVVTVAPAADGLSAVLTTVAPSQVDPATNNPIPVRVTVTADALPGPGNVPLIGVTDDIIVQLGPSSLATQLQVPIGSAIPK